VFSGDFEVNRIEFEACTSKSKKRHAFRGSHKCFGSPPKLSQRSRVIWCSFGCVNSQEKVNSVESTSHLVEAMCYCPSEACKLTGNTELGAHSVELDPFGRTVRTFGRSSQVLPKAKISTIWKYRIWHPFGRMGQDSVESGRDSGEWSCVPAISFSSLALPHRILLGLLFPSLVAYIRALL
jgi:hypothetical protein